LGFRLVVKNDMRSTLQPTLNQRTLTMTQRTCGFKHVGTELRKHYKDILDIPIVYRWWFPADCAIVLQIFNNYPKREDASSIEDLFPRLKKKEIQGKVYYALYVGQSENGHHRFSQHCSGNTHISTLRKTIAAICFANIQDNKQQEEAISNLLDSCYFEWIDFPEDAELVETIEALCIAVGCYPLNMDANRSVDEHLVEYIMEQRKKIQE